MVEVQHLHYLLQYFPLVTLASISDWHLLWPLSTNSRSSFIMGSDIYCPNMSLCDWRFRVLSSFITINTSIESTIADPLYPLSFRKFTKFTFRIPETVCRRVSRPTYFTATDSPILFPGMLIPTRLEEASNSAKEAYI